MTRLDFADLRAANVERQAKWCPEQVPDLSFRGNELGGECGEALNVIKKLERERLGWRGSRDTVEHLAEELANVVICADLCAITAGIDLGAAVVRKFDATSEKVGIPVKLGARTTLVDVAELVQQISALLSFCNPVPRIPNTARILLERSAAALATLQTANEYIRLELAECERRLDADYQREGVTGLIAERDALKAEVAALKERNAEHEERFAAESARADAYKALNMPTDAERAAMALMARGADEHRCPICAKPFKVDDLCATDITEGICHAACLEGSPVVDLETGEETGGKADTYRYGDDATAENGG